MAVSLSVCWLLCTARQPSGCACVPLPALAPAPAVSLSCARGGGPPCPAVPHRVNRLFPRLRPHYLIKQIYAAAAPTGAGGVLRGQGYGAAARSHCPSFWSHPALSSPAVLPGHLVPAVQVSWQPRGFWRMGQTEVGMGWAGSGTLGCCSWGLWDPDGHLGWRRPLPAGSPGMLWVSPGMLQRSLAPVTFPFPSLASTKRVCYIFNILRALLVGIYRQIQPGG